MSWLPLAVLSLVAASLAVGGPAAVALASSKSPTGKAAIHHVSGTLESYDTAAKTITVLIDCSASMQYGTPPKSSLATMLAAASPPGRTHCGNGRN